jgi:glutamine amidotransferase|tara:strand:- start:901 stop:1536 length:636 start_codon:yes stop_codon:yes gene_type:complete
MMKNKKVGIIDCGAGNLASVYNAVDYLGFKPIFITEQNEAKKFSHLILPGVGSYAKLANSLQSSGWSSTLKEITESGTFLFGICIGMQLLFEKGEEGGISKGVGLFSGTCKSFGFQHKKIDLPVPHIGFNEVSHINSKIWQGIPNNSPFYFVHAYRVKEIPNGAVVATTNYGESFISFVENQNVFGSQFHPEKSHNVGLKLLKNFIELKNC